MYRVVRAIAIASMAGLLAMAALVPAAAAESTTRPFKGSLAGGAVLVADASCPFGMRTDTWGSGDVSHFGTTSMTAAHCTQFMGAPETGVQTFVAANGDELEVTYSLAGEPFEPVEGAAIAGHGQTVVTGGTGRFAGASGEFIMYYSGIFHLAAPMELWFTWNGEISF